MPRLATGLAKKSAGGNFYDIDRLISMSAWKIETPLWGHTYIRSVVRVDDLKTIGLRNTKKGPTRHCQTITLDPNSSARKHVQDIQIVTGEDKFREARGLKVWCDCADFQYRYGVVAWRSGFGLRNPPVNRLPF